MLQPVEASVSGSGVEPSAGFVAKRREIFPCPFEDFAHDVLGLVRFAYQCGGIADKFGMHREEEFPETFLLRGFSSYVEYR